MLTGLFLLGVIFLVIILGARRDRQEARASQQRRQKALRSLIENGAFTPCMCDMSTVALMEAAHLTETGALKGASE